MKLQVSDHIDAKDWDETVSRLGGTIYHSSAWAKYSVAVKSNFSELYITFIDDKGLVAGAALAFAENSNYSIINFFTKRMLLFAVPAVSEDDELLHKFIFELEKYCRRNGFVELGIFSHASPDISETLTKGDYDLVRRYEFIIDLDRPEEEIWRGLGRSFRRNIKNAEKNGVTIHEFPVEESVASLERLHEEDASRILRRKGIDLNQSKIDTIRPCAVFTDAGRGRFFSAVVDNEIVSTSLFTLFNGIVCHNISGSNDAALKIGASKFLIWHAIKSYREDGAVIFNLGGCKADAVEQGSSEHGVYQFKKSSGANIVELASGEKILGRKRKKFISLVKSVTRR